MGAVVQQQPQSLELADFFLVASPLDVTSTPNLHVFNLDDSH